MAIAGRAADPEWLAGRCPQEITGLLQHECPSLATYTSNTSGRSRNDTCQAQCSMLLSSLQLTQCSPEASSSPIHRAPTRSPQMSQGLSFESMGKAPANQHCQELFSIWNTLSDESKKLPNMPHPPIWHASSLTGFREESPRTTPERVKHKEPFRRPSFPTEPCQENPLVTTYLRSPAKPKTSMNCS